MELRSLPPERLIPFVDRTRKFGVEPYEAYLHTLLVSALSDLNEFLPSEGLVVLLDDPAQKKSNLPLKELVYVAVLGEKIGGLLEKRVPITSGVVGETYTLGKSTFRKANPKEKLVIDKVNYSREISSVLSVPLRIENNVVGVVLSFNKKDGVGYTLRDLKLMEIFAGYIATSLQNAVDARKARELSKRDDLTGLYNDRYFHFRLEEEIQKALEHRHSLCLLFIDLDQFKQVNDQFGHLVGSQTLKEVGLILREAVPIEPATLVRYGGDEYVVILPKTELDQAEEIAHRIRKMISKHLFMIDQGDLDGSFVNFKGLISASVGVASLHDHVQSGSSLREKKNFLVRLADAAMYRAKEQGKNAVCIADPSVISRKN